MVVRTAAFCEFENPDITEHMALAFHPLPNMPDIAGDLRGIPLNAFPIGERDHATA